MTDEDKKRIDDMRIEVRSVATRADCRCDRCILLRALAESEATIASHRKALDEAMHAVGTYGKFQRDVNAELIALRALESSAKALADCCADCGGSGFTTTSGDWDSPRVPCGICTETRKALAEVKRVRELARPK